MSASSEKKRRQNEREQGVEKRQLAQREAEEKAKKSKTNWTIGTVLVVLLLVVIFVLNSSLPYQMTAFSAGNETFNAAEMKYFYANAYNSMYSYLGWFGVDTSKSLADQECSMLPDGGSWQDYLRQQAQDSAKWMQAMYEEAQANGYTLSEDGQKSVEDSLASLAETAKNSNMSVKKYLKAVYGTGVTENMLKDLWSKSTLASEYAESVRNGFTYTDEELTKQYEDNIADYQTYDYLYYFVAAETEDTTDEAGETVSAVVEGGLEASKAAADEIAAAVKDADSFNEAVAAYAADAAPTAGTDALEANIGDTYREWVTDPARKAGDVTTVSSDSGTYVVMYQSTNDNHFPEYANVRHILIKTDDTDGDGTYSDTELAAARTRILELQTQWEAGERTEEAFAALAEEYSQDEGSNTNGGLYEDVTYGQMVAEFNDFCFDPARKPGDVGVVHGSTSSTPGSGYDGYHLIYFVSSEGRDYSLSLAENTLRSDAYSEWETATLEKYTTEVKSGMNLVKF